MNCCVNVVSASFQQFPVNNCNNKLLRRPSGKSQIHPNFANNSIVNITTEKYNNGQELFTQCHNICSSSIPHHQYNNGQHRATKATTQCNNYHMTESTNFPSLKIHKLFFHFKGFLYWGSCWPNKPDIPGPPWVQIGLIRWKTGLIFANSTN